MKTKRILSLLLAALLLAGAWPLASLAAPASEAEALTLSNGYIQVSVSRENGGFTLGTAEGDRLRKSDNNKQLLYHDGEYDTSFISFEVEQNGVTEQYVFGGKYGGSGDPSRNGVTVTQPGGPGTEIIAVWSVGELTFTQTIALANEASKEHGLVSIAIEAKNRGAAADIRARVLYDTYLGSKDFGYYQVADGSSVTHTIKTEQVVDASNPEISSIPQNFFATDDPVSPQIAAYTASGGAVAPFKAAFGHWNNLASSLYDFTPDAAMDFTDPLNGYLTADSAYALYYDLGTVAGSGSASLLTFYGVFSNSTVSAEERVALNVTAPTRLELNADKSDYEPLLASPLGAADFQIGVTFENYASETSSELSEVTLAVTTTGNLRSLSSETGQPYSGREFETTDPFNTVYQNITVGDTRSKTLNFEARLCENAAYERVTIGVYDTSESAGALTQEKLLGEQVVYILLPGSDGGVPEVGFTSMTPNTIYSSGTRHLYVALTNASLLDDRGNWSLYACPDGGGDKVAIPNDSATITIKDGVMDVAVTADIKLAVGSWHLQLEWSAKAVNDGVVPAQYAVQTADALRFTVSDDPKYKNDAYGVVAVVQYKEGVQSKYRIKTFKDEAEFNTFKTTKRTAGDTEDCTEILLVFRGEFTLNDKLTTGSDDSTVVHPLRLTAVSKKTLGDDRKYVVDNCVTLNNCLDFEGGSLSIYYENYEWDLNSALSSGVRVEFDGELLTSVARTSVWKGKAALTEISQGEEFSLLEYDENGNRSDSTAQTVKLVWPTFAGAGQTIAGMVFNLAFGELGVIRADGGEKGRVVSFSAKLDLSFTGAADPKAPQKDTYWSRLKEYWSVYNGDTNIGKYAFDQEALDDLLNWDNIDESPNEDDKTIAGSVMVRDILFGCGEGFYGLNFTVSFSMANYISALPKVTGTLSVNTINNWSFSFSGGMKLSSFSLAAKLSFKSHNDIPVPDDIYFSIGGFKPGVNIDGLGVVWITGGGGGISDLYDTIFLTQAVPPLKLIMSVTFSIVQILDGEATMGVGLTGVSIKGQDLKIFGTIEAIRAVQLGLEWYPGIDLKAAISVNLFNGILSGGGYIVLIGKDYTDWFFEMFARVQVSIPQSIPLIGGMNVAGADLGISTEKIWGAIDVLSITLGITYYWGDGGVDFGVGSKTQPTYPDLLGYEDVPIYYDSERGQTLYARFGTNISEQQQAELTEQLGAAARLMDGAGVWSNFERTSHKVSFGVKGAADAVLQLSFAAESLEAARETARSFTINTAANGGGTAYPVRWYAEGSGNAASCNANVSFDADTGMASFALSADDSAYGMDWYIGTGSTAATAVLYGVDALPKLTGVSVSGAPAAGGKLNAEWTGTELSGLNSISFFLTESADSDDAGTPIGTVTSDFTSGSAQLDVPSALPEGDYYLRAVYVKDGELNGVCLSGGATHVTNGNTPSAASIKSAAPCGDLKMRVTVANTADVNTDGYAVTVYDAGGNATDVSGLTFEKAAGADTVFEIGGAYSTSDGLTLGLAAGVSYTVGVTPYKLLDSNRNGQNDTLVYGAEARYAGVSLPAATTPNVALTAAQQKKVMTRPSSDGSGAVSYDLYTASTLNFTLSSDTPVTGTWSLDGGETFSAASSAPVALAELSEGDHTLTVTGKDSEGDGFRLDYAFTVDTTPPRLILSSPVNGGFYSKNGTLTISGVTDPDALLTVTCDGAAVVVGKTVAQMGGAIGSDGVFTAECALIDPNGASAHQITVTAADAAGNSVIERAEVHHGGLADIASLLVMADNRILSTGNIPVGAVSEQTNRLKLAAVTSDGIKFVLSDQSGVSWQCQAVSGSASVTSDGVLTLGPGSQGIVTGRLQVTQGAYLTQTLTFGASYGSGLVSISSTIGGTVTGGGVYNPGDTVTLKASPDTGYTFGGWSVTGAAIADAAAQRVTFTMPASGNVSVEAVFTPASGGRAAAVLYTELPAGADPNSYVPYYTQNGKKVYVQLSAVLDGMLAYLDPGAACSFEEHRLSFADISGHWAESDIVFAAARELVNGMGGGLFEPDVKLTRAMFLTLLYRFSGCPAVSGAPTFDDVGAGLWYTNAVLWGSSNNIVEGYNADTFGPNDLISREQMCTILARYLSYSGYNLPKTGEGKPFADAGLISAWAAEAVALCRAAGLVDGKLNNLFDPVSGATRAESCAVLRRMIERILAA